MNILKLQKATHVLYKITKKLEQKTGSMRDAEHAGEFWDLNGIRLYPSTRRALDRCPSIVAQTILDAAAKADDPNHYIVVSVRNWEIEERRRALVEEKRREEREWEDEAQAEVQAWDMQCRAKALSALSQSNSINAITLVLWIESGLPGSEFAKMEGISQDTLYQRKMRARKEVLAELDAPTAAWLYDYGFKRSSFQRADTLRRKTCRL